MFLDMFLDIFLDIFLDRERRQETRRGDRLRQLLPFSIVLVTSLWSLKICSVAHDLGDSDVVSAWNILDVESQRHPGRATFLTESLEH